MSSNAETSYETVTADVAIIGGGPAGAAAARVLAERGHRVTLIARAPDPVRSFAESLPPSARQLLATLGLASLMDDDRFVRCTGNTVWWGDRDGVEEPFAGTHGIHVIRPSFDRILLAHAEAAGVTVVRGAVTRATEEAEHVAVHITAEDGETRVLSAQVAIDCSGRSGAIARPHRTWQEGLRGQAFIGLWRGHTWPNVDPGHTLIEAWADGWGWSVPAGGDGRYVGLVVDARVTPVIRAAGFDGTYRAALQQMRQLSRLTAGATLERAWACDASAYFSGQPGGRTLLAGDAASFIEPLSSFGIKKALASGWIAGVAAHTMLRHPDRVDLAAGFVVDWEARAFTTSLTRSREFAREASQRFPTAFWQTRADLPIFGEDAPSAERDLDSEAVRATFDRLRSSGALALCASSSLRLAQRAVIDDGEIVAADAVVLPPDGEAVRYLRDVDVLQLVRLAPEPIDIGSLIEHYLAQHRTAMPVNVLAAIALLVARGAFVTHCEAVA